MSLTRRQTGKRKVEMKWNVILYPKFDFPTGIADNFRAIVTAVEIENHSRKKSSRLRTFLHSWCHAARKNCENWWFSFHQNRVRNSAKLGFSSSFLGKILESMKRTILPIFTLLLFHSFRLFTCDNYTYSWTTPREKSEKSSNFCSIVLSSHIVDSRCTLLVVGVSRNEWIVCKFPFSIFI